MAAAAAAGCGQQFAYNTHLPRWMQPLCGDLLTEAGERAFVGWVWLSEDSCGEYAGGLK